MSKPGKLIDGNKIDNNPNVKSSKNSQHNLHPPDNRSDKHVESLGPTKYKTKLSLKQMQATQSDGNIIKEMENTSSKQKTMNKDMVELASDFEGLALSLNESEDTLFKSDWLRARDSLENVLVSRPDKAEIINSKSTPFPQQEKSMICESPCSESQLGNTKALKSVTKVLTWDPWDKLGRKNKKDNKRQKKYEKSLDNNNSSKDHTAGDELRNNEYLIENAENEEFLQTNVYRPYHPKMIKTVEFTNEVTVVYITGGEVVAESTEPLKKELEQQIRNKEMRRGHSPTTLLGNRRMEEDYMSAWLKK